MRVLDLFSGIGGFSLGLERAGMETVAFCEYDEPCRKVLRKHWPDIPIYPDIRELTGVQLEKDGITDIGLICGGFPCQDISVAKTKGKGIRGEKSGLFFELARLVSEIRPQYVFMENTPALLARGMGDVVGELAALRYVGWWDCIPARAIGAPHQRDRIWIVAHSIEGREGADRWPQECQTQVAANLADTYSNRLETTHLLFKWRFSTWGRYWKETQPPFSGMDDGISFDLDSVRQTGNAVVPQIPEIIGRAIMAIDHE